MDTRMYGTQAIVEAADQPLEKWPNPASSHPYLIHIEHPEFTALCPRSGYPDFGTIIFDYVPSKWVIELKAFKLYINAFRNQSISHEAVVNKIADRLYQEITPQSMRMIGDFMRRGNVKTVISVYRGSTFAFPDFPNSL